MLYVMYSACLIIAKIKKYFLSILTIVIVIVSYNVRKMVHFLLQKHSLN